MRVEPLAPDVAPYASAAPRGESDFSAVLDSMAEALADADSSEDAFAYGTGSLGEAVYERAKADIALSVATATAQRAAQSVQAVLNMQV